MQLKTFTISLNDDAEAEVNAFLRQHRVLSIDRHFVDDGANSFWAICISYIETSNRPTSNSKKTKIDYREVLSENDFALYAKLRDLRKTLAEREGVPPYALFTNEQLASMVQNRVSSKTALKEVPGVGDGRVDKYGSDFIAIISETPIAIKSEKEKV